MVVCAHAAIGGKCLLVTAQTGTQASNRALHCRKAAWSPNRQMLRQIDDRCLRGSNKVAFLHLQCGPAAPHQAFALDPRWRSPTLRVWGLTFALANDPVATNESE